MRLSKVFELLENDNNYQGFSFSELRPFQLEGILSSFQRDSTFVVNKTGSGKTTIAKPCLAMALVEGRAGVYLVPHVRLLDEKAEELQRFFQETAHIIKLSGEFKPTQEELRKHNNKVIFVATYEAFQAFLFQVQNRKYFTKKKPFGAVVVDEIHKLGDKDRGWKLETLLYKLKDDFGPILFCCLSATFDKEAAKQWSELLGCKLIYRMPDRVFAYEEVIKRSTKMEGQNYQEAQDEKVRIVLQKFQEFVMEHSDTDYQEWEKRIPHVKDAKMLVFCNSRNFSKRMADKINEWVYYSFKGNNPKTIEFCEKVLKINAGNRDAWKILETIYQENNSQRICGACRSYKLGLCETIEQPVNFLNPKAISCFYFLLKPSFV